MSEENKLKCPVCGFSVSCAEEKRNHPLERLDACWRCKILNRVISTLGWGTFLSAPLAFFVLPHFGLSINLRSRLNFVSITFCISGAIFLFGYIERSLVSLAVWDNEYERVVPKHVWLTRWGLVLVLLGLGMQLILLFR